ncbi:unnamed protein product [Gadus morhua 'NCC']
MRPVVFTFLLKDTRRARAAERKYRLGTSNSKEEHWNKLLTSLPSLQWKGYSATYNRPAPQPCSSALLLSPAPQPCSSALLLISAPHAPQPCSSSLLLISAPHLYFSALLLLLLISATQPSLQEEGAGQRGSEVNAGAQL